MQNNLAHRNKQNKKILVTGGTGFIGKVVVSKLSKFCKVRIFARKKIQNKAAEVYVGDILRIGDLQTAMDNIDCIVHLAALMQGNEKDIYAFNVNSTKVLVDMAVKKKIRKFIFLSSENAMWPEQNAYGESKKKCEELVKQFPNYLILRSTAVYGKGSKVILGKILNYVKHGKFLLIPGDGKSLMQPIYVEDVSRYILNGIKYDIKGTYVIAGKSKISFNEFIDTASRVLKSKKIKVHVPLWLAYIMVFALELFLKSPPIKLSQLKNLNTDRIYKLDSTVKDFKYEPIALEDGIKMALG